MSPGDTSPEMSERIAVITSMVDFMRARGVVRLRDGDVELELGPEPTTRAEAKPREFTKPDYRKVILGSTSRLVPR